MAAEKKPRKSKMPKFFLNQICKDYNPTAHKNHDKMPILDGIIKILI